MCIATKRDGKSSRTVNIKALDRACPRQSHSMEPPFKQASGTSGNIRKTRLDVKDGYHATPIVEEDRKHTTDITLWGCHECSATSQDHLTTRNESGMVPTRTTTETILNCPEPRNTSGIGGFFRLVEQIARAFFIGWMALSGWILNPRPVEEASSSEKLQVEAALVCEGPLNSMDHGTEDEMGGIMATQLQLATGRRVTSVANKRPLHWTLTRVTSKEDLSVAEGEVIHQGKLMIPSSLRGEALAMLHSGNQGISNTWGRAVTSVWWSGLHEDTPRRRTSCWQCDSDAPSQPKEPSRPLLTVEYPFQKICSEYFSTGGRHYLVLVDRYSGWPSMHVAKTADDSELVRLLRKLCETFGVPEELSSDRGLTYVSQRTRQFLYTWGISHRELGLYPTQ